jgi:hypothetical protein
MSYAIMFAACKKHDNLSLLAGEATRQYEFFKKGIIYSGADLLDYSSSGCGFEADADRHKSRNKNLEGQIGSK